MDTSFRVHDGDVLAIRLKEEGGGSREFFATTHNDLFTGYLELTPCPSPYDGDKGDKGDG